MDIYEKLTEIFNKYNNIIIMTHKNPDLDGLSSAIILSKILTDMGKTAYVYRDSNITNDSVLKMLNKIENKDINYIDERNYSKKIDSTSLLVILDVNKKSLLDNEKLLAKTSNIIVIDHHIRPKDYIKEAIYTYINSNLSSIAEFITNYIKYLNKTISPIFATILLAAIEIDTNSFNIKTTENTHLTAAYLMSLGADNVEKQELLKENKDEYLKRQDLLKNSYMLNSNTALCIFDNNVYKKEELAISAEELLQFEGVEASFVIGKTSDKMVSISARSLGKINVEVIMKNLGGGGHLTEAASDFEDKTIKEVKALLIDEVIK